MLIFYELSEGKETKGHHSMNQSFVEILSNEREWEISDLMKKISNGRASTAVKVHI